MSLFRAAFNVIYECNKLDPDIHNPTSYNLFRHSSCIKNNVMRSEMRMSGANLFHSLMTLNAALR